MSSVSNDFVVVTPAFNCQDTLRQTIKSVYSQSYDNWRMIVYDDMSTDNTATTVEDMSRKLNLGSKLQVVSRTEKYGEVRNTLDAVKSIDDNEVVCRLDAGDWLTDNDSLAILNQVYQNDISVAWTAHRWAYTSYNISKNIDPSISVYDQPWVSSHLKTFRRSSLRGINHQNFLDSNGNYIVIACDQAIFLPMMRKAQMEERPLVFVPMVMYHYSIDLQKPDLFSCDRSQNQKTSAEWIRERGYVQ